MTKDKRVGTLLQRRSPSRSRCCEYGVASAALQMIRPYHSGNAGFAGTIRIVRRAQTGGSPTDG